MIYLAYCHCWYLFLFKNHHCFLWPGLVQLHFLLVNWLGRLCDNMCHLPKMTQPRQWSTAALIIAGRIFGIYIDIFSRHSISFRTLWRGCCNRGTSQMVVCLYCVKSPLSTGTAMNVCLNSITTTLKSLKNLPIFKPRGVMVAIKLDAKQDFCCCKFAISLL